MSNLLLDLRYSLRTLTKSPGFTVVAVLTLAFGIGANTAIFSLIESVLLRPLPYSQADRLVMLWGDSAASGNHRGQVSFTDTVDWRNQTTAFEEIGAFAQWSAVLNTGDSSERAPAIQVDDGFFRTMNARPMLGRLFVPEDQIDGKDFEIVISNELWRSRFAADPNVIGRRVHINALPYTVVGVLPADFESLPRNIVPGNIGIYRPCAERYDNSQRDSRHFRSIGRLKSNVALEQAQAQLSALAAQIAQAHPKQNSGYGVRLSPLREEVVGGVRPAALLLYGGVVFVLLIACANLANLLLVRFTRREREMAIRVAIGAPQWRLIRQMIVESLLLATAGGVLGLTLAAWLLAVAQNRMSTMLPLNMNVGLNLRVLLFTVAISLAAGIVFGLAPALHGSRLGLANSLKTSSATSAGGNRSRLRDGLVVAEVALSLALLSCSGLLIRTMQQLARIDPGFRTDVTASDITLPFSKYGRSAASVRFYDDLLARVSAMPEVTSAGVVSTMPFSSFDTVTFKVEGRPEVIGRAPDADRYIVSAHYLETMGIAGKKGRLFDESDRADTTPVMVVSETLAKRIWPGEDPIGKRIRFPDSDETSPWRTVVGVVADVKQYTLEHEPTMQFYVPYRQEPSNYMTLAVRGSGPPTQVVSAIRQQVRMVEADASVSEPQVLSDILATSIQSRRMTMILLSCFAGLALLLAAIGIFGVLSYAVSNRVREIGVRIALGAHERHILRMVLGDGMRLVAGGIAVGLLLSFLTGRSIRSLLFGVQPFDTATLVAITLLLVGVAAIASYLPARRAATVDPMEALRSD